jgi:hypothetical protein
MHPTGGIHHTGHTCAKQGHTLRHVQAIILKSGWPALQTDLENRLRMRTLAEAALKDEVLRMRDTQALLDTQISGTSAWVPCLWLAAACMFQMQMLDEMPTVM